MLPQDVMVFIITAALSLCVVTFVNTHFSLFILIVSMLLSPELEIFQVPQKAVAIRLDDFLIGAVFLTWMAKMAIFKEVALFRYTSLNRPMILYIMVCIISTLLGLMGETVRGQASFFFILKYFEYFLIFFMFVNNIETKQQIQKFLAAFLLTALVVCCFALSLYGKIPRLTAPFEGGEPEPASLGGYLLVMIACGLGLLSYPSWPRRQWVVLLILGILMGTLSLSSSRGALAGFVPLYATAILLASKRRIYLIFFIIIAIVLGTFLIPPQVVEFMKEALTGKAYQVGGFEVELGMTGVVRLEQWKAVLGSWKEHPILGLGVTGVGLVDSQFVRVLGETGIIGALIFGWLLLTIFRVGFSALRFGQDNLTKALGMALVCANVGLIVQGITANSYIIVRIMEPFWFLAAVVVGMLRLSEESSAEKETS